MSISALDKNTVKFLKTSQVITSVPYAVKELVENSLDANSKNIEVNLFDDGLTHIEVKDDGSGISKVDAPLMAMTSYTSKIKYFEDLEKIHTYGFRGEALHALSQVAQLTIVTREKCEEIATSYDLDTKGNIAKSESCSRSVGTTVQVKGLFKNMPVRRQNLLNSRRTNQDLKYLEALLKSFGIIQPNLRITYRRNKQIIFIKSSVDSLTESIANILGKEIFSCLEWVEENFPEGKFQLMLPKTGLSDATLICQPGHQFIFVNKKILVYKEIEKVLNKRIHEYFLNKGVTISKKCLFFLNIMVDPSNLDINLEPNKTKGFLKNESKIIEIVDKILIKFYQLKESQEERNEKLHENSTNDISSLDETNDNISSVMDNEVELPAIKKRKIDFNGKKSVKHKDTIDRNSDERKSVERKSVKSPMIFNIKEPILSESDSNSDNETHNKKKRSSVNSKRTEKMQNGIEVTQTGISTNGEETLSQLPVVDLGEEFSQLYQEKSNEELHSSNLISNPNNNEESIPADIRFDNDFTLVMSDSEEESKTVLKQSTLILNTSINGELMLEVDKNKVSNQDAKPLSLNSWSRGHVPELSSGTNVKVLGSKENEQPNKLTGFNIFFSQVRPELMKENPEMSVPQVASLLTNRWKEMSCEEKVHYQEMANEKVRQEELQSRRDKKQKQESEKNKKRLLKLLKNMKSKTDIKSGNETLKARTTTLMETSIGKITEKSYRNKPSKQNTIIGPLKPSLWVVSVASQFWLLDVTEMFKKLNFTDHGSHETNAETLEKLLEQWTLEEDDFSILYVINQKS